MADIRKKKNIVAIVPAAGSGKRFGSGISKPFQYLGGKPLLIWPIETLAAVAEIAEVVPVLKTEYMEAAQKMFEDYGISKIKRIAPGGKERQDSVYNGLRLLEDENCIVLIHDGVRPLIEKDMIEKAIEEFVISSSDAGKRRVSDFAGVILGVPVKDTIKEAQNGMILRTLNRKSLWAVQTPQIFSYRKIMAAYDKARTEEVYATDDASLIERYGGNIKVITGSYRNIKITTPEDIVLAEALLKK